MSEQAGTQNFTGTIHTARPNPDGSQVWHYGRTEDCPSCSRSRLIGPVRCNHVCPDHPEPIR